MATHSSILTWKILWTEEPDLFTGLRELVYEIWSKLPTQGFSHSSVGKESTCNAGDPSSIPGLGRSAGEGLGYPLQYSWAFLMAQLAKNPPAMGESWV